MTKWDKLISRLESHRTRLVGFRDLVGVFREMDSAHSDMLDIEVRAVIVLLDIEVRAVIVLLYTVYQLC